jgi:4-hydroxy 2-oxovalerate aldolase
MLKDSKGWVSYRPEIKILDCTIRDGGLMNDHKFDNKFIKAIYETCVDAGVDYMEIGYKCDRKVFAQSQYGAWKFCNEDDLRKVLGDNDTELKISVMADAERTDYKNDFLKKEESVIDLIRVATYIHQIPTAIEYIKDATDKGYETTVNIMAVSTVQEWELDAALEALACSPVGTIYLVDSFGSLYHEQVAYLARKYIKIANEAGKKVGIHTHNNLQLAYSNTITAIIEGANMLDATIDGMGRGAGNCPLELLIGFLHNPKYHQRPVLKCLQELVRPMRKNLLWGYEVPYLLTGMLNLHPRSAMKFMESGENSDYVRFYDSILQEES